MMVVDFQISDSCHSLKIHWKWLRFYKALVTMHVSSFYHCFHLDYLFIYTLSGTVSTIKHHTDCCHAAKPCKIRLYGLQW